MDKIILDEPSLEKMAEETYKTLEMARKSMAEMGLPEENSIRSMVISAYILGAREVVETLNNPTPEKQGTKG